MKEEVRQLAIDQHYIRNLEFKDGKGEQSLTLATRRFVKTMLSAGDEQPSTKMVHGSMHDPQLKVNADNQVAAE